MTDKIIYRDEGYKIQGAIFAVYREMGAGFLEPVYQECLEREFGLQQIPFVAQPELTLHYKGERLQQGVTGFPTVSMRASGAGSRP